jgi:hypothetical protein
LDLRPYEKEQFVDKLDILELSDPVEIEYMYDLVPLILRVDTLFDDPCKTVGHKTYM